MTAVVILESVNPHLCQVEELCTARKNKKRKKNYNVLTLRKRNLSENEALVNMTKNRRNNTKNSYSTTDNGMTEFFRSDLFSPPSQNPPAN